MFKKLLTTSCGLLFANTISLNQFSDDANQPSSERRAICILYPNASSVKGIASFSQQSILAPVSIALSIKGLSPNSKHEIDIHGFAAGMSQESATESEQGLHTNNDGNSIDKERQIGNLGSIMSDPFGNSYMCVKDKMISLFGQNSVIGSSVSVHTGKENLEMIGHKQSQQIQNSGQTIACGVIGLTKEFKSIPKTN